VVAGKGDDEECCGEEVDGYFICFSEGGAVEEHCVFGVVGADGVDGPEGGADGEEEVDEFEEVVGVGAALGVVDEDV
jgi:hypothetical protein